VSCRVLLSKWNLGLCRLCAQTNTFPERGTVYDFCFDKKGNGQWIDWMDTVDKHYHHITPSSKVFVVPAPPLYLHQIWTWVRSSTDWIGLDQDFQGTLWIGLDCVFGWDDCDPVFKICNHCSTVDAVSFKQ